MTSPNQATQKETAAIELRGLEKSFGAAKIIQGIDLSIERGERHAIIGPNGAGKSTLFNLITGKYTPTSGDVFMNGAKISGLAPYKINRMGLSRSFQITNVFPELSVFENIRCALLWEKGYRYSFRHLINRQTKLTEKTDEILEQINLSHVRDSKANVLAYADLRALEIGITIAGGADIIMMDEPCAGMSTSETEYMVNLIRQVTASKTLIIVEHDMGVVFDLADRISVLVYGEVIATDIPENIRGNQAVKDAYLGSEAV